MVRRTGARAPKVRSRSSRSLQLRGTNLVSVRSPKAGVGVVGIALQGRNRGGGALLPPGRGVWGRPPREQSNARQRSTRICRHRPGKPDENWKPTEDGKRRGVRRRLSQFVPAGLLPVENNTYDDQDDDNPGTDVEQEVSAEVKPFTDLLPEVSCVGQGFIRLILAVSCL